MHKESANKFDTWNSVFLLFPFLTIIFYVIGNGIFVHSDDTMVADSDSVRIFPKVVNNGLSLPTGFSAHPDICHGTALTRLLPEERTPLLCHAKDCWQSNHRQEEWIRQTPC